MSALTLALLLQVTTAGQPGAYPEFTYVDAYKAMQETGQPMLILVGAKWCPACRNMHGNVLPMVARRGNLRYVAYTYVDVDKQRALARHLQQGTKIPQLIMFYQTPQGWKRVQTTGGQSISTVERMIDTGVKSTLVVKQQQQERERQERERREHEPEVAATK